MALHSLQRLLQVSTLSHMPAPYEHVLRLQELLWQRRKDCVMPDTILQLQHTPVYTVGKRGGEADFLANPSTLVASVYHVPRGGETTYHGPGQLVVYPIVNLRYLQIGARAYVEGLEDALVCTLGQYGIPARGRVPGKTGVWVGDRKIAALGVRISHGITSHGVALNVSTDLTPFQSIIPCGTPDKEVTSVQLELGDAVPMEQVARGFLDAFKRQFKFSSVKLIPDVHQLVREEGIVNGTN